MSLPPRGSVSGTVLVVVCVVICHTEAQPLDTMRRICILQGNSSRDQIHVLPMFKTVEDRLRFQLEAFEHSPLYVSHAIEPSVVRELFTETDVIAALERRYSQMLENPKGGSQHHSTTIDGIKTELNEVFEPSSKAGASLEKQIGRSIRSQALQLLSGRNSLVLHSQHDHLRKVAAVTNAIYSSLFVTSEVNVYVSPPKSTPALRLHHDVMDVFIIQVNGKKTWNIYPPVMPLPLFDQHPETMNNFAHSVLQRAKEHELWASTNGHLTPYPEFANSTTLPVQLTLGPGDILYLPRGTPHHAVNADSDTPTGVKSGIRGGPKAGLGDIQSESSVHMTVGLVSMPYIVEEFIHTGLHFLVEGEAISSEQEDELHQIVHNLATGSRDEDDALYTSAQNEYHAAHFSSDEFSISEGATVMRSTFMGFLFAPRTFAPVYSPCLKKKNIATSGKEEKVVTQLFCSTVSAGADTSEEEVLRGATPGSAQETLTLAKSLEERRMQLQKAQIRKIHTAVHAVAFHAEQKFGTSMANIIRKNFNVGQDVRISNTKKGLVAHVSDSPSFEESVYSLSSESHQTIRYTMQVGAFIQAKKFLSFVTPEHSRPARSAAEYPIEPVDFDYRMSSYDESEIGKKYSGTWKNDTRPFLSLVTKPKELEDIDIEETLYRRRSDIAALVIPADNGIDFWDDIMSQLHYVPQLAKSNMTDLAGVDFTHRRLVGNLEDHKKYAVWVQGHAPTIAPRFLAKLAEAALVHPPGIPFTPIDLCLDVMSARRLNRQDMRLSSEYTVDDFDRDYSVCLSEKVQAITKIAVSSLSQLSAIGVDSGNWPDPDPVKTWSG
eukprot:gb/GECG01015269.1/.p1 GENE.gb/GECG01015269.1/~~gb/GECG01015269.1/.p1  ORF type:complete len:831 (+),score=106.21 gb/GECG01015269.1/:1-2493(+)